MNNKFSGCSGKPSVGGEIWGPDSPPSLNPAVLWSGAGQKVKWAKRSGERDLRKWSWAMSGKFCRSAPLTCAATETSYLLRDYCTRPVLQPRVTKWTHRSFYVLTAPRKYKKKINDNQSKGDCIR